MPRDRSSRENSKQTPARPGVPDGCGSYDHYLATHPRTFEAHASRSYTHLPTHPPTPHHIEAFSHIFSTLILPLPSSSHLLSNCCSFSATLNPQNTTARTPYDRSFLLPYLNSPLATTRIGKHKVANRKNDLHTNQHSLSHCAFSQDAS